MVLDLVPYFSGNLANYPTIILAEMIEIIKELIDADFERHAAFPTQQTVEAATLMCIKLERTVTALFSCPL